MAAMNLVFRKQQFNVYAMAKGEYIIHNRDKEFSDGHTHVTNFKTVKYLIDLCIHKSIPHGKQSYFLISLSRLTDDNDYKDRLLVAHNRVTSRHQKYGGYKNGR